jgi:hypothetical protein
MPEELLDIPDVRAALEKVHGNRVPEQMRMDMTQIRSASSIQRDEPL